ncbi:MAG: hypothetical protein R3E79_03925 [Caldilineaceae bacterium]
MSARRTLARLCTLSLVVALLLAGCLNASPAAQPGQDGYTIRIMTWHGPDSITKYYAGYK